MPRSLGRGAEPSLLMVAGAVGVAGPEGGEGDVGELPVGDVAAAAGDGDGADDLLAFADDVTTGEGGEVDVVPLDRAAMVVFIEAVVELDDSRRVALEQGRGVALAIGGLEEATRAVVHLCGRDYFTVLVHDDDADAGVIVGLRVLGHGLNRV